MGSESVCCANKLEEFLNQAGGCLILDGGFATQLESLGADLNDPLWSALCLITMPHLIQRVHMDYLEAGADIIISSSYQATLEGFAAKGLSREEGEALLKKSVFLACGRVISFWNKYQTKLRTNPTSTMIYHRALVAASIGSYGAYLADGSEYSGNYGPDVSLDKLKEFHRRRLQILSSSGADILALETIPCKIEAQALIELLDEENVQIPTWLSFNSKDGTNVVSGDSFHECVSLIEKSDKIAAVGINCTPPRFIHGLILIVRKATSKPIVIYPNSGETWDGETKRWMASTGVSDEDFVSYVPKWIKAGASLVGGCCRTTPNTILAINRTLRKDNFICL